MKPEPGSLKRSIKLVSLQLGQQRKRWHRLLVSEIKEGSSLLI